MALLFQGTGYAISRRTDNFIQLRFEIDPTAALPVDLMWVSEGTFRRIQADSVREIGSDRTLAIPSALHLIAMKLHALKNPQRVQRGTDLPPIKYDESSNPNSNSKSERVRESAAFFDLPALQARGELERNGDERADRFQLVLHETPPDKP